MAVICVDLFLWNNPKRNPTPTQMPGTSAQFQCIGSVRGPVRDNNLFVLTVDGQRFLMVIGNYKAALCPINTTNK